MSKKWEEEIIVVAREELFEGGKLDFQGAETDEDFKQRILSNIESNFTTMRRGGTDDPTPKENNAEINLDYKQPITYAIIRRGNEIFTYERLTGGGEARLHGKLSVGVGGHMNKTQESFNKSLYENLTRELEEELIISYGDHGMAMHINTLGLINDELNEVGKVHLGILAVVDIPDHADVTVRETDQLKGVWVSLDQLADDMSVHERLETWSKIAIDLLASRRTYVEY